MLFNSLEFALFFVVVTAAYFLLPHKFRWSMLLIASCGFYMAFVPVYILILALTIVVDYAAAIWMEEARGPKRKILLIGSIACTVLILAVFKYFNFLNGNLAALAHAIGWNYSIPALSILLPIGLSFHTFQSMSYVIEVYFGRQKAERHFGIYSLYVMFYPQLVAGPIERPQNLLHQFREPHRFDALRVTEGLRMMFWGLFKKVVIADRLAQVVNTVYERPHEYSAFFLALATVFFAFQIYCDFSGYSDIAIGAAKVMGFNLMKNFDRPYRSRSVAEFWSRWHISLSTWFRDYLYIPLGGNRAGVARWYFNLFMVFMVSGLWHGANWTFVIWGALHGCYIVSALLTRGFRERAAAALGLARVPALHAALQICVTFLCVCVGWVFFRAASVSDAWYVLSHSVAGLGNLGEGLAHLNSKDVSYSDIGLGVAGILVLEAAQFAGARPAFRSRFESLPALRWGAYAAGVSAMILFGVFAHVDFIYFQF
jgi:alginate O-acetyltransferase complex protein AlgI